MYEGWTNYETWAVKLWIDNEQGSQEYWREEARQAGDVYTLAARLKEEYYEQLPDLKGWAGDLLEHAYGMVDWEEIAEAMLEDLELEEDDG